MGLEVNELPFLLFCRQGQERQQRQQGKQTLEVSWAVRGVLLEGGALFLVYLFLFCRRLAADPFASQTSTRAVRVTPLRNPQLRMNLQGRAPQESATADEPPLQRGLTTSCPWSWPLGTAPQLRLQRPCPCRCPCWRPFPGELCPPKERSGELPGTTSAGQRASA